MLHYLAVHDFGWINSTVTGRTVPFDYEKLEASMAAQYAYGKSNNAVAQAGNLLDTILTRRPFKAGNLRTAFIATVVFLTANKYTPALPDEEAAGLFRQADKGEIGAGDVITKLFKSADLQLREGVTLRTLVTHICNEHISALTLLAEGDE